MYADQPLILKINNGKKSKNNKSPAQVKQKLVDDKIIKVIICNII